MELALLWPFPALQTTSGFGVVAGWSLDSNEQATETSAQRLPASSTP
jgi:hypothetical protein